MGLISWSRSPNWSYINRKKDAKSLKYLAMVSFNHNLNTEKFFRCLVDAWKNGEAYCDKMHISCRKKSKDSIVLLLEDDSDVLGQIPLSTRILKGNSAKLKAYIKRKKRFII